MFCARGGGDDDGDNEEEEDGGDDDDDDDGCGGGAGDDVPLQLTTAQTALETKIKKEKSISIVVN